MWIRLVVIDDNALSENLRTSCNSRTRGHTEKKCFCGSDSLDPNFSTISEFIHIVTVVAI